MERLIDSKTWKVIEIAIMRYPEHKKKLKEMEEDIILSHSQDSGRTNFDTEYIKPQSVTESKAMKLNSGYYARLKRKVKAVEKAYNSLLPEEQKVIKCRYWINPRVKIPYEKLDCNYSKAQMQRIVQKTFYQVGVNMGELEER